MLDDMPRLIQAGMGVRISGARLANATSRLGALGVVSSVGLRHIIVDEVRRGDPDTLDLARTFPIQRYVDDLLAFAPGGPKHRRPTPIDHPDPKRGELPRRLSVIAAFVEVARARRGHLGQIGVNVMWKCALTVLPSIYGAMLAGADALLCGAGVPMELPDVVHRLRAGEDLRYDPLHGTGTRAVLSVADDGTGPLLSAMQPPRLIPILSNFAFPKRVVDLWHREHGGARPSAFVLENHEAGGHNAPPRNKAAFGEQDDIEAYFDRVLGLGVPVYVAGAFERGGTRDDLLAWQARGAYGIQVGSRFALCDESGMERSLKDAVIAHNASGGAGVVTDGRISPTGYPFKCVPLEGTLADPAVYRRRQRICNRGYLLQSNMQPQADGSSRETYVCPAMPERQYLALGGDPEGLDGRICLCNALLATAGILVEDEPALVTLGRSGRSVVERATARQVVESILTPQYVAQAEAALAVPSDARPGSAPRGAASATPPLAAAIPVVS